MKKVFVLDDDPGYQKFMSVHLQHFEYHVVSFLKGSDLIKQLRRDKPQLIILDNNLCEQKTGLDYLKEIRLMWPNIPVLMLTSQPEIELARQAMHLGVTDYIQKNTSAYVRLRTALDQIASREHSKSLPLMIPLPTLLGLGLILLILAGCLLLWHF